MALSVVCIVIVLLLGLLVIGLLRSHADILRALHSLGAGVDEVSSPTGAAAAGGHGQYVATPARRRPGGPVVVGPPLPHERQSDTASDVAGTSPDGAAVSIAATGVDQRTLFAFLTTGCVSCAGFWEAFEHGGPPSLPEGVRPVIVTKGPEHESPAVVAGRGGRVPVVMSTAAWSDYEVPGSPFFVLVDGPSSRRIGEGSAPEFAQIVGMVERALAEAPAAVPKKVGSRLAFDAADREREARNDRELLAAGITPGHPSLYPSRDGRPGDAAEPPSV